MKPSYPVALLVLTIPSLLACGAEEAEAPVPTELLAPPPAGQGVQFAMTTTIPSGVEAEHCKFVQAPPDGLFVSRDEVRFTEGSHHVLLFETTYTTIPTTREDGSPYNPDANGVFDCTEGPTVGFNVTKLVGGSQNPDGDSLLSFPEGVAMAVSPNRVLLLNAHYINATNHPVDPEVRMNLYTIPQEKVTQEGDILFWYHPFIKVDAQSQGSARMRCMLHQDITLMNVQSHMHARGTGFAARQLNGEPFYTNTSWEDVEAKEFNGGMALTAGTWLDYQCDYTNTGSNVVIQGPRSTDEMCVLLGSYYPVDRQTSVCAADPNDTQNTANLGAEWVGSGQATCADTFACVQQKVGLGDFVDGISTCINSSDPGVSKELSDALRCFFLNFGNPQAACQTQFDACLAK